MAAIHLPHEPEILAAFTELARELEDGGYNGLWTGEVNSTDGVAAAALAASATENADIGVLVNVFTRAPTLVAMSAWTLGHIAPQRAHIVLGVASPLLVERWNGIAYRRLADRLADVLRFVRLSLDGRRVAGEFATITSSGFALPAPPELPPKLLVAACGPRALALAATEADGVVLNWVGPGDLDHIKPLPSDRSRVSIVVPICPTSDRAEMEEIMRPVIADYLMAPAYANQQRRLGRGDALEPMWEAWERRDRQGARHAVPTSIFDELVVWGAPVECRERLALIEAETGARTIATYFPTPAVGYREAALAR